VRVRVQHRSVLAVGSIGVAVKHCAAHWTEKKRHATLQRTTAQPAQSMAVLIRITSRREHESSRARHDSPATPLARTPRCGSHLFQNCGESRTQSHRLAWQEKIPPQYRTCLKATQLPTATSLIVIPSFGRTYISPDAAEFANSRRRALQVDGTLEPFGYAHLHRQPHLRVAQGSFEVQPLLHVVVLQEVTLICSILRRWSAGCKRSIRHHIALRHHSVLQFKSNRISHTFILKCKIHRQTSLLHPSPPLNNEAYTSSTTNHPDPPPQCASRCMTTHLSPPLNTPSSRR
jgi:hypothetical protein